MTDKNYKSKRIIDKLKWVIVNEEGKVINACAKFNIENMKEYEITEKIKYILI